MLTTTDLRARIATAVEAISGFSESRWSAALLGSDTSHVAHKSFAVDVPSTRILSGQVRQKLSEGLLVQSDVVVAYVFSIRGDAQVADMAAALTVDQSVLHAVMSVSRSNLNALMFDSMGHALKAATNGSWRIGTLTFRAVHQIPPPV